eukprot:SAG22_NODE_2839_length_2165_cov_1.673282_1_plen_238_part_10
MRAAAPLAPLLLFAAAAAAFPRPAGSFQAYVSISRKQNAWWRSIVNTFGGECAGVCTEETAECPRECSGHTHGGIPFTVFWHQNLVEEKVWLDELEARTADPADVVLFSKYCSSNGGCNRVVPSAGWGASGFTGDGSNNDGRAYMPLIRRGFGVYFFEYAPDLEWMHNDPVKWAAIFGGGTPMLTEAMAGNSTMVLQPDFMAAGNTLGRIFCRQTSKEVIGRQIVSSKALSFCCSSTD